jgi:hypothetical protein
MAKTPEGKVKDAVKAVLNAYTPVWYFMPVSGGYGVHGIPDFVCCVAGRYLVIECKAGRGRPTALQLLQLNGIRGAGGVSLLIRSVDEASDVVAYLHMLGAHLK